jgi:hypothetical protein
VSFVVVWETDDGPAVDGPYPNADEAMLGAWRSWDEWAGGIVGGWNEGTFAEFQEAYAESGKVWVVPLSDPS